MANPRSPKRLALFEQYTTFLRISDDVLSKNEVADYLQGCGSVVLVCSRTQKKAMVKLQQCSIKNIALFKC